VTRAAIVLAAVALLAGWTSSPPSESRARVRPAKRLCFPARLWDAPERFRPCARVVRVVEDGSVWVAVSDHDGTLRYTGTLGARD
jgi:hypothetical protein